MSGHIRLEDVVACKQAYEMSWPALQSRTVVPVEHVRIQFCSMYQASQA